MKKQTKWEQLANKLDYEFGHLVILTLDNWKLVLGCLLIFLAFALLNFYLAVILTIGSFGCLSIYLWTEEQ